MKIKAKKLLLNLLILVCFLTFFLALSSCDLIKKYVPPIYSSYSSQESSIDEPVHHHDWRYHSRRYPTGGYRR